MNAWLEDADAVWRLAGWTMLHFLWVGAAVAAVGGMVRVACRRASAGMRYAVSLASLAALALASVGVARVLIQRPMMWAQMSAIDQAAPGAGLEAPGRGSELAVSEKLPSVAEFLRNSHGAENSIAAVREREPAAEPLVENPSPSPSLRGRGISAPLARLVEWLPCVWLAGAPLTFAWLMAGLVGSRRLRRTSIQLTEGPAAALCRRLQQALRITRRVAVAACDGLAQPVLVGIVKPTILLPAAALSGWTPQELEMVLVHELAHVRRWDNLVNLGQRVVEALLFFHPCVWLVSRQVRRDREECCDAIVVGHTRQPEAYASLLVSIAAALRRPHVGSNAPVVASALADHPLAGRVRRILKLEDEPMWISRRMLGVLLLAAIGVTAAAYRAAVAGPPREAAVESGDSTDGRPEGKVITRAYPIGDIEAVDFTAWLRLASSNKDVEIRWDEDSQGLIVAAPKGVHDQISAFLEKSRTGAREELAVVLEQVKRNLKKKLDELKRKTAENGAKQFEEFEFPKLKIDIAQYQTQLNKLDEQLADMEAMKEVALMAARSPSALASAVQADMDKDPTINMYKQNLFELDKRIQELKTSSHDADSSELKRLIATREQTNAQMAQHRKEAEKEARDRLAKVPNEALRAAIAEYNVRVRFLSGKKADVEKLLKAAEERIAEMSVREPDLEMLKADITALQELAENLDQKILEWKVGKSMGRADWPDGVDTEHGDGEKREQAAPSAPRRAGDPARRNGPYRLRAGDSILIRVIGAFSNQPIDDAYAVEEEGTVALGPTYGRVTVAGMTVLEAEKALSEHLSTMLQDLQVQVTLVKKAGPGVRGDAKAVSVADVQAEPSGSPFFSAEDQAIADMAYDLLGWELEPLTQVELAAVRQHGFEGGLRIESNPAWKTNITQGPSEGSLLVGLHTRPIKDLDDLREFLERSDIGDLSPVKFYVLAKNGDAVLDDTESPLPSWQLQKGRVAIAAD